MAEYVIHLAGPDGETFEYRIEAADKREAADKFWATIEAERHYEPMVKNDG